MAAIRSQPAEIYGSKRPAGARGSASNRSRPMQVTRNAKIKSLQTMRNTSKEKSSPTSATSSGQDIQAHVAQSDGDITAPIRPRGAANVGPTKAVQPPSQPIRQPRTPSPRPVRLPRVPTATDTPRATVLLLGRRGTDHALHGEDVYPRRCIEFKRRHHGALLRTTVVGQRQHRHEVVLSVVIILDVRSQLPHIGPVVALHLAARLRVIRLGIPVGDPE